MPTDFRISSRAKRGPSSSAAPTPVVRSSKTAAAGAGRTAGRGGGRAGGPASRAKGRRSPLDHRTAACLALMAATLVILVLAIILPSGWFSVNNRGMTAAQWLAQIQNRATGFVSLITFQGASYSMDATTWRYLIVALAGAALAVSGAVFQGSLRNALASPSTLGVMTGCNLGRIVYVLCFSNSGLVLSGITMSQASQTFESLGTLGYIAAVYGMALASLACGFIVVAIVLGIATIAGRGHPSGLVMIISGQIVGSVIGVCVSLVQYYFTYTNDYRAELLRTLQVESFSYSFRGLDVVLVAVPVAICLIVVLALRSRLDLLTFGEDQARSMGVSTRPIRWAAVGACTALTAVIVSFCGQVGMVGFLIPHFTRRIVGPQLRWLIPASALTGASFLVLAYFTASLFSTGAQNTLGVFVSIVGAIAFIIIAIQQRGKVHGDWA